MIEKTTTKASYTVTERAGPVVAGRRGVAEGDTLVLTTDEAEYELREGTIVPVGRPTPKAFAKSPTADRLRREAAAAKSDGEGKAGEGKAGEGKAGDGLAGGNASETPPGPAATDV